MILVKTFLLVEAAKRKTAPIYKFTKSFMSRSTKGGRCEIPQRL